MLLNDLIFILVRPQMGENIGATARAMLNCGLSQLRLVAPRDGWPNERAFSSASSADSVLQNLKLFDTVKDAVADCQYVLATTARARDQVKKVYTPVSAAEEFKSRIEANIRCAVLFGPERTGLENDDLIHADGLVTIPLNPDYSSLNLAQAALLIAWEYRKLFNPLSLEGEGDFGTKSGEGDIHLLQQSKPKSPSSGATRHPESILSARQGRREIFPKRITPATKEELESFFSRLENELQTAGFYTTPEIKPAMIRNVRNFFTRAELTDQDVRTLHGIVTALKNPSPAGRG